MFSSLALYHSVRHGTVSRKFNICAREISRRFASWLDEDYERGILALVVGKQRPYACLYLHVAARHVITILWIYVNVAAVDGIVPERSSNHVVVAWLSATLLFREIIAASLCIREDVDIPFGGLKSSIAIGINSGRDTDKARY
jgi:hypothetical protein